MTLGATDGVLLVAHGTVSDLDDMPEFLSRIRHGRPASQELVSELRRRYETVGGSPLLEITRAQATALAKLLDVPVLVGMRLWTPSVEQALIGAAKLGLSRLAVLPLAPFSVHVYMAAALDSRSRVEAELGARTPELLPVRPWGENAEFIAAHRARIGAVLAELPAATTELVLTAHSLPMRAIRAGDSYADQVAACAQAIGASLGRSYRLAYQSQGADGGEWLGPDLDGTLRACKEAGKEDVVVAPFGFLADHIETLYDLDVEAKARTSELGLRLHRIRALNDDPKFISALGSISREAFAMPSR